MAKPFLTEYRGEISFVIFILSIAALVISIPGIFFLEQTPQPLKDLVSNLKAWHLWLLLAGVVFGFAGGYYFFTTLRALYRFKKLIRVETKTQFSKNEAELERLCLDLPERFTNELKKAKEMFGTEK
jgi:H+/Cl- antiporter ClcA